MNHKKRDILFLTI